MKFAVISDIHSNLYALQSVLDDIKQQGINTIYCTGDLIGYLTDPNGVIDLIKSNEILTLLGNHDEKYMKSEPLTQSKIDRLSTREVQKSASYHHNNQLLSSDNRLFIKSLPRTFMIKLDNYNIQFVHGSPDHSSTYMYEEDDKTDVANKSVHNVIIFGHTHIPYHQVVCGVHFINPGSVGKPKDGDYRASYAVLTIDKEILVEFRKIEYDIESIIEDIKSSPMISNQLIEDLKQ